MELQLETLPPEVLLKVFGLLPEADLKTMYSMKIRFQTVIDEGLGFSVAIGMSSGFSSKQAKAHQLDFPEKVLQRGVSVCYVANLLETIFDPSFKFPKVVKKIHFEGPITHLNFHSLLTPLSGLQHLTLHFSALASEGLKLKGKLFSDCILKSLSLTSTNCQRAMEIESPSGEIRGTSDSIMRNMTRFTENSATLFTHLKSPRLSTLLISMPLLGGTEKKMSTLIINSVCQHSSTLENVQVYFESIYKGQRVQSEGDEEDSDELEVNKTPNVTWSDFKGTTLRRFCFTSCDYSKNVCDEDWVELIRRQENLSELFYLNRGQGPAQPFILNSIGPGKFSQLKKTLIHLNATEDQSDTNPLDLGIFRECLNLTHLLLRAEPIVVDVDQKPRVKNIRFLPKLITVLSIRDIFVSMKEADAILEMIRKFSARRVRLLNVGCTGLDGMRLTTFFRLLEEKQVEEFEFTHSINLATTVDFKLNMYQSVMVRGLQILNKLHAVLEQNTVGDGKDYFIKDRDMFAYQGDYESIRANDICNVVFK